MFDIGWMELLLIGIVALIVVGPKDLPKLFRAVGHFMGKARGMAREFQRSMEQAADEAGLSEVSRDLNSINKLNLNSATGSARKYAEGLVKAGNRKAPGPSAAAAEGRSAPARPAPAEGGEPAGRARAGAAPERRAEAAGPADPAPAAGTAAPTPTATGGPEPGDGAQARR